MALCPAYPTAACARGVIADIRIIRVVRPTAGTPLIAIDEGHVALVYRSRPPDSDPSVGEERRSRGAPDSDLPIGEKRRSRQDLKVVAHVYRSYVGTSVVHDSYSSKRNGYAD